MLDWEAAQKKERPGIGIEVGKGKRNSGDTEVFHMAIAYVGIEAT